MQRGPGTQEVLGNIDCLLLLLCGSGSLKPRMAEATSHACWLLDTYMWSVPVNFCCKSVCASLVEPLGSICKVLLSSPTSEIKTGWGTSFIFYFDTATR